MYRKQYASSLCGGPALLQCECWHREAESWSACSPAEELEIMPERQYMLAQQKRTRVAVRDAAK
jgi:hypothetical protein